MVELGMSNFNQEEADFDFALPNVETPKSNKPKLHITDATCVNCE